MRGQIVQESPMATKFDSKSSRPSVSAMLGSKVMQRSARVNRGQIAQKCYKLFLIVSIKNIFQRLRNSVGGTPDQSIMHYGVKDHAVVSRGQSRVKLLRNAL